MYDTASTAGNGRDPDWGETLDRLRGFVAAGSRTRSWPRTSPRTSWCAASPLVRWIGSDNIVAWLYRSGPQRRHRPLPDAPAPCPDAPTWITGPSPTRLASYPTMPPASSPVPPTDAGPAHPGARDALSESTSKARPTGRQQPTRDLCFGNEVPRSARPTRLKELLTACCLVEPDHRRRRRLPPHGDACGCPGDDAAGGTASSLG